MGMREALVVIVRPRSAFATSLWHHRLWHVQPCHVGSSAIDRGRFGREPKITGEDLNGQKTIAK